MVIGIDPGNKGGISMISKSGALTYFRVPLFKKVNLIDGSEFLGILNYLNHISGGSTIVLEDVHSIPGASAKSNFGFGKSVGITELVVRQSKIPFEMVPPKEWQKNVWINSDKVPRDTKKTSLNSARRLYPSYDFLATKRSTVPHDGIVDATLIAHYKYTKTI